EICLRELVKRPGFVRRVARDVELEAKLSISKTRENRSLVDVLTFIDGVLDDVALDRGRDDAAPTRLERSEKRHRRNDVALGRRGNLDRRRRRLLRTARRGRGGRNRWHEKHESESGDQEEGELRDDSHERDGQSS